jgi:hypothetical protein
MGVSAYFSGRISPFFDKEIGNSFAFLVQIQLISLIFVKFRQILDTKNEK